MSRGTDNTTVQNSPAAKHTRPEHVWVSKLRGDCIEKSYRPSPYREHEYGWNILEDITTETHHPNLTYPHPPRQCCCIAHCHCVLVYPWWWWGQHDVELSESPSPTSDARLQARDPPLKGRTADHRLLRTQAHTARMQYTAAGPSPSPTRVRDRSPTVYGQLHVASSTFLARRKKKPNNERLRSCGRQNQ